MNSNKKLYKDCSRKKICGVLAGISDYLNADVTLLRVFFILLTIIFTPCIILYIIFAFIMPEKNDIYSNH
ncbi:MAG: PspC domain-containing protein [Clostridium butyricum]|nr:PspC domain-containing protein [Clostridium butyricum]